jgi:thiol-disulfide isomerase/thioredoxin
MRSCLQVISVTILLLLAVALQGCDASFLGGTAVGDMTDLSYNGQREDVQRPNAHGKPVALEQFAGRFVWTDYAAPWCGPCLAQTRNILSVERSLEEEVVFLTIMTSEMRGYGHPATPKTATRWADRFGLEPERVLADDLATMTIPKHRLFSPDGQLLFEKTGLMSADRILATLTRYMNDWREWKEFGTMAEWML